MPDFHNWHDYPLLRMWYENRARSASVGSMIADKPVAIVIQREVPGGAAITLVPQIVRLDVQRSGTELFANADIALVKTQRYVLLGYRNHPVIADTDIRSGDSFAFGGSMARVIKVEDGHIDRVTAFVELSE